MPYSFAAYDLTTEVADLSTPPEPTGGAYWAASYWAPRYWANRYWPKVGVPAVAFDDLLEAVVAWLLADATVMAELPGGVWVDEAGSDAELPFLLIVDPQDSTSEMTSTDGDFIDRGTYQFSVYAESTETTDAKDEARRIVNLIAKSLNDAPLVFALGDLRYFRQSQPSRGLKDPEPGPHGMPVYQQMLIMEYVVARSL